MPTTVRHAASIFFFEFGTSTANAVCSIGVERPMPHSTRPCDSMSTVATFSAIRAGWMNSCGISATPKPSRICSVICDSAPSTTSLHGMWLRPSRKWCSTSQAVWKPFLSASAICSMQLS